MQAKNHGSNNAFGNASLFTFFSSEDRKQLFSKSVS